MAGGPGTIWQKQPAQDGIGPPQWVQVGSIVGPAGAQGKQGSQGAAAAAVPGSVPPLSVQQLAMTLATANVTNTTNVQANVTNFSFPIGPNETWTAEVYIFLLTNAGGAAFQWTGPAAPTFVRVINQGASVANGTIQTDSQAAFSSASAAYANSGASNFTVLKINLLVQNGVNAGIVQLQFASGTNGNTTQVLQGSYMSARRIA